MGNRLHVTSTYKVEYASIEFFNGQQEKMNEKLEELFNEYCHKQDDYFWIDESHNEVEIGNSSLKYIISRLKQLDPEETCYENDDFTYNNSEIIEVLQYFVDNCDKDNDFIRLSWF